jgi:hypothetical protein
MPCFSYYILCFFFYKKKTGRQNRFCPGSREVGKGLVPRRRGDGGKKGRRMNMVQIMYTQVSKCSSDTC